MAKMVKKVLKISDSNFLSSSFARRYVQPKKLKTIIMRPIPAKVFGLRFVHRLSANNFGLFKYFQTVMHFHFGFNPAFLYYNPGNHKSTGISDKTTVIEYSKSLHNTNYIPHVQHIQTRHTYNCPVMIFPTNQKLFQKMQKAASNLLQEPNYQKYLHSKKYLSQVQYIRNNQIFDFFTITAAINEKRLKRFVTFSSKKNLTAFDFLFFNHNTSVTKHDAPSPALFNMRYPEQKVKKQPGRFILFDRNQRNAGQATPTKIFTSIKKTNKYIFGLIENSFKSKHFKDIKRSKLKTVRHVSETALFSYKKRNAKTSILNIHLPYDNKIETVFENRKSSVLPYALPKMKLVYNTPLQQNLNSVELPKSFHSSENSLHYSRSSVNKLSTGRATPGNLPKPEIDIKTLADNVYSLIENKFRVERERRGMLR